MQRDYKKKYVTDLKKHNYKKGVFAEVVASIFLRIKLYSILKKRWRYGGRYSNEIDIIATRFKTLSFIEVKFASNLMRGSEALTPAQQIKIEKAAMAFLSRHAHFRNSHRITFDLIVIRPYKLPKHYVNAWEPKIFI